MQHRPHIRTGAVDAGVQMALERRLCGALEQPAVEVHRHDVVCGQRAAHRRARIDEEPAALTADAAMPAVVDDARALEHADGIGQHRFRVGGRHAGIMRHRAREQ